MEKFTYRIYAVSPIGRELVGAGSTPFRAARQAIRKMGRSFFAGGKVTRSDRVMERVKDSATYFDWY